MPAARHPAADPTPGGETPPSFESAMERLEGIVEQMENARLPLEELIRCYEEGTQLIKVCSERLSAAEQRIEIITRDAAGQARVVDFPPAAAAPPAAPPPKPSKETKPDPAGRAPNKQPNEVSLF